MRNALKVFSTTALVAAAILLAPGCRAEDSHRSKTQTIEGIITSINQANHRVAMKWRDPKDSTRFREQPLEGAVTDTTEIWINGRRAVFVDLRVDDRVTAVGYRQGEGKDQEIIAEKLTIVRLNDDLPVVGTRPAPATQRVASTQRQKPVVAPTAVGPTKPKPSQEALYRMVIEEFKRKRRELVGKREELLKSGASPSDPAIVGIENSIRKADQYLAQVEDQGAARGIGPDDESPATLPAGSSPATQPHGGSR